jgi:hypothetical protein
VVDGVRSGDRPDRAAIFSLRAIAAQLLSLDGRQAPPLFLLIDDRHLRGLIFEHLTTPQTEYGTRCDSIG